MSKKCIPLWREVHVEVCKSVKDECPGPLFEVRMWFCVAGANSAREKSAKREGKVISPGSSSIRDMFIRDVRRCGHCFPKIDFTSEHQILRFAKIC